jgi:hypothetical protein
MAEVATKQPWLLRMHYRMRTTAFAMLRAASSVQIGGKGYGLGARSTLANSAAMQFPA